MLRQLDKEFNFAGFEWPKYVWTLPKGPLSLRLHVSKRPRVTGPYYHTPKPTLRHEPMGFYLDAEGQPFNRWLWADDVEGANIRHTGWYCEPYEREKMRGIVARLPHGRYLAGWSMGENMSGVVYPEAYDDIVDAARMADEHARVAADNEREYQEAEEARMLAEEELEREREYREALDDSE